MSVFRLVLLFSQGVSLTCSSDGLCVAAGGKSPAGLCCSVEVSAKGAPWTLVGNLHQPRYKHGMLAFLWVHLLSFYTLYLSLSLFLSVCLSLCLFLSVSVSVFVATTWLSFALSVCSWVCRGRCFGSGFRRERRRQSRLRRRKCGFEIR